MSKSTKELREIAQEAQRAYDKAMHDKKANETKAKEECKECKELKDGEVLSKSTKDGFVYASKSNAPMLVKHAIATIKATLTALKEDEQESELAVAMLLMELIPVIKKEALS